MTGCVPALSYAITNQPIAALAAPAGIGLICSTRTKKDKTISKAYDSSGIAIPPELPERELRIMGLWDETYKELPEYSIEAGKSLPDRIAL
jgi:hypothetical protein